MNMLGVTIFESIRNIFRTIGGDLLGLEGVLLFAGVSVALIIIGIVIAVCLTTELKTSHAILRINNYLATKPYVTDENIVEFNKLMKRLPKPMREQWQKYMINRTEKPSAYMNIQNCVDKPIKTSTYKAISQYYIKAFFAIVAILTFGFSLGAMLSAAAQTVADLLLICTCLPIIIFIIGTVFNLIINTSYNALLSDIYYNFEIFEINMDRAVTTLPKVVDFEVLFTRKEIINGIPALQEYLEQRAIQEEQELAIARDKEVEHETYDFSKLGVNGSLVMERSLKESEFYLGNRKRLLTEIEQISSEKDSIERQYDEKNKASQRKLREIRETLDRLKEKLSNTTNKIIGNDIRKQQADEVRKQQVIENELDEDSNKYEAEIERINGEIEKRKQDIEKGKQYVEKALNDEFSDFATKIYNDIRTELNTQVEEGVVNMKDEIATLQEQMEEKERIALEKQVLIDERDEKIAQLNDKLEEKTKAVQNLSEELSSRSKKKSKDGDGNVEIKEVFRYFDANGNEFFYDSKGEPYYIDENNKIVYYYDNDGENGDGALVENETPLKESNENVPTANVEKEEVEKEPDSDEMPVEEKVIDENLRNESIESISTPSKKRGRPKKEPSQLTQTKPAGKRGRPKKEVTQSEEQPKGKRGRPKKEKSQVEENKPTGKRGRPKKEPSQNTQTKPTGKRGRPKKEQSEATNLIKETKKGRGRPKKETSQTVQEKPAGKRGRPKKVDAQSPTITLKNKKGRGRPKKELVVEEKSKGRGRPKKEQIETKGENDLPLDYNEGEDLKKLEDIQNILKGVNARLSEQKDQVESEKEVIEQEDVNSKLKDMLSSLDDDDDL